MIAPFFILKSERCPDANSLAAMIFPVNKYFPSDSFKVCSSSS